MIICSCFNISEKDIKNKLLSGDKCIKKMQNETSIGKSCGMCLRRLKNVIKETEEVSKSQSEE